MVAPEAAGKSLSSLAGTHAAPTPARAPSQPGYHTPISGVMQHLDLSDEEAAALIKELANITGNDRYPFSARIQTLRAILAKLRPEPAREPAPLPKVYAPPRATAARRRQRPAWRLLAAVARGGA